jgi:hypothetical protein
MATVWIARDKSAYTAFKSKPSLCDCPDCHDENIPFWFENRKFHSCAAQGDLTSFCADGFESLFPKKFHLKPGGGPIKVKVEPA